MWIRAVGRSGRSNVGGRGARRGGHSRLTVGRRRMITYASAPTIMTRSWCILSQLSNNSSCRAVRKAVYWFPHALQAVPQSKSLPPILTVCPAISSHIPSSFHLRLRHAVSATDCYYSEFEWMMSSFHLSQQQKQSSAVILL